MPDFDTGLRPISGSADLGSGETGETGAGAGAGAEVGAEINMDYDNYPPSEDYGNNYRGGVDDIYKEKSSSMQYSNPMVKNPMFRNPMQGTRTASRTPVVPPRVSADHIEGFDEEDLSNSAQQQSR